MSALYLTEKKKYQREFFLEKCGQYRRAITEFEIAAVNDKIIKTALSTGGGKVVCYVSMNDEFPTLSLIKRVRESGLEVYLPVCDREKAGEMEFFRFDGVLKGGRFGISEPPCTIKLNEHRNVLMIVPCVACDEEGFRLGKGGGYYDRYLPRFHDNGGFSAALCYDGCYIKYGVIAREAHDIPCMAVITEKHFEVKV